MGLGVKRKRDKNHPRACSAKKGISVFTHHRSGDARKGNVETSGIILSRIVL